MIKKETLIKKVRLNATSKPLVGNLITWRAYGFKYWRVIKITAGATTDEVVVVTVKSHG